MTVETLREVERLHGWVAWAASIALVVTAWRAARAGAPWRGADAATRAALGLVVAASALGLVLHDPYRARLRQRLFLESPALGWLFERKHHLAFAALLLGVGALAGSACLKRAALDTETARDLRRSAVLGWAAAAALALAAAIASAVVARRARF